MKIIIGLCCPDPDLEHWRLGELVLSNEATGLQQQKKDGYTK